VGEKALITKGVSLFKLGGGGTHAKEKEVRRSLSLRWGMIGKIAKRKIFEENGLNYNGRSKGKICRSVEKTRGRGMKD